MAVDRTPITLKFGNAGVRAASVAPVTYDSSSGEIDVTTMQAVTLVQRIAPVINTITNVTLEMPVRKTGLFSSWTDLKLEGDNFRKLGELAAWRVTLWEADKQLAELQSFLWSGVEKG